MSLSRVLFSKIEVLSMYMFGSDFGRNFGNITHQYGCHDESLILQVFNDLSVNVAVTPRKVDTLGTVPSTDFLQSLFAIQFDDV